MKTFKALAALLTYPEAALIEALPEVTAVIQQEALLPKGDIVALQALMDEMTDTELMTLQERYVDLFDRARALSLHLFEHVHGESRDRGQAMVDLAAMYGKAGLVLADNELPDYLPALLEFLSRHPPGEAKVLLKDAAHILDAVAGRLARRGSRYSSVFDALLSLAGAKRGRRSFDSGAAAHSHAEDTAHIDRLWAEQPAFGGAAVACQSFSGFPSPNIPLHRGPAS